MVGGCWAGVNLLSATFGTATFAAWSFSKMVVWSRANETMFFLTGVIAGVAPPSFFYFAFNNPAPSNGLLSLLYLAVVAELGLRP